MFTTLLLAVILSNPSTPSAGVIVGPASPAAIALTKASQYNVSRHQRTDLELIDRATEVLQLFSSKTPDAALLEEWARTVLAQAPERWLKVHPLPDSEPGLVVMYQPLNDDLIVMDLIQLHRPPWPPTLGPEPVVPEEGVGELYARDVMRVTVLDLEARGVIPDGFSTSTAELGVYREKARAGSESAAWNMEYQWTMNRVVDDIQVIDAGIRIGIHHEGRVSSIRITDVLVALVPGSSSPIVHDTVSARELLTDKLTAQYPSASIHIEQERVAIILDANQSSAILTPSLLFNYSLGFLDTSSGTLSSSRQQLTSIPLTGGDGHNVFPIPGPL